MRVCLSWAGLQKGRGCRGGAWLCTGDSAVTVGAQLACTVVAILLQFLYMSAVGWALLEGLHLYRRRSEPRHVDRGPMRFYHVLGWGLPAFITGEATPTELGPAPFPEPTPRRPQPSGQHPLGGHTPF